MFLFETAKGKAVVTLAVANELIVCAQEQGIAVVVTPLSAQAHTPELYNGRGMA